MAQVVPLNSRSLRQEVTAEEWATRVDLAACYRLVALYGMTDLVYNHITARVPGSQEHVLINPYGMLYDEITASSLIKIDLEGNTVLQPDHEYSVNAAGYVIHSAVHGARHDAGCVIHTHTRAGTAVSALKEGLMPLSQTAMRFAGRIAYHEYEGPAFNRGERERLVADLADRNAMILRNHGLLVCAPTIPQAFNLIYWLEQACKISDRYPFLQSAAPGSRRGCRRRHFRGALGCGNHARQRGEHQSAPESQRAEGRDRIWPSGMAGASPPSRPPRPFLRTVAGCRSARRLNRSSRRCRPKGPGPW